MIYDVFFVFFYKVSNFTRQPCILRLGKNVDKQCYPSSDHQVVRGGGWLGFELVRSTAVSDGELNFIK